MKALIFNSGLGRRLGNLTADKPKSMVQLSNGESIFERQLRILQACGITEYVITTGPFSEQLKHVASRFTESGCSFTFVQNDLYAQTNYIYSMYLARNHLRDDDVLLLHGDLVFDASYAQKVIDAPQPSLGSVNATLPLPAKDFKARVIDNQIAEVSVNIFDDTCSAFQPFYKLTKKDLDTWLAAVEHFVDEGKVDVYAEDAANTVFNKMCVEALSYEHHLVEEVDTPEDLKRMSSDIRLVDFEQQPVFEASERGFLVRYRGDAVGAIREVSDIAGLLKNGGFNKPLLICGKSFDTLYLKEYLFEAGIEYTRFSAFSVNPKREEVLAGAQVFLDEQCDTLMSIGGGSAIDVAKSIIMHLTLKPLEDEKEGEAPVLGGSSIKHLAIPTTAGTGSESTHFSVMYAQGVKKSLAHDRLLPDYVVLDASLLSSLPIYQKKSTLLDALCQAIESYWSVASTAQSKRYAEEAIRTIVRYGKDYLAGGTTAAREVSRAANNAGKAINLTKTTAAHAMSYKLSTLYGVAHGHAVALCLPGVWQLLLESVDKDGAASALKDKLSTIALLMKGSNGREEEPSADPYQGLDAFNRLYASLELEPPAMRRNEDIQELVDSVDTQRLSNFPLKLEKGDLRNVYESILVRV